MTLDFSSQMKNIECPRREEQNCGAHKSAQIHSREWGFLFLSPFLRVEFKTWGWTRVPQQTLLDLWWSDENLCLWDHHHPVKNKHNSFVSECADAFTNTKISTTNLAGSGFFLQKITLQLWKLRWKCKTMYALQRKIVLHCDKTRHHFFLILRTEILILWPQQ